MSYDNLKHNSNLYLIFKLDIHYKKIYIAVYIANYKLSIRTNEHDCLIVNQKQLIGFP